MFDSVSHKTAFIPSLTEDELARIAKKYHVEGEQREVFLEVYEALSSSIHTAASTFLLSEQRRRVLGLEKREYYVGMITLGERVDWQSAFYQEQGLILEAYMTECLGMELLSNAYEQFDSFVHGLWGQWPGNYVFPGDKYPLSMIKDLIDVSPDKFITYNEAYALLPSKSVVFLFSLREEKKQACNSLCTACANKTCENWKGYGLTYGKQRIFGIK
ncbi:MAG: hypothetical protein PWP24_738 [Clostridiales bacterium]|nr:hypothetical protein [Clostridiales bacterium]